MPISRTQLRLAQITGSFGDARQGILDTVNHQSGTALSAVTLHSGSLVGVLSHMASAIKRINGGHHFAAGAAGVFANTSNIFSGSIAVHKADNNDGAADLVTFSVDRATGNTVIAGNLTVNGTTTTIESTTLAIEDKLIKLNKDAASAGNFGTSTGDAGFIIERTADSGAQSGFVDLQGSASDFAVDEVVTLKNAEGVEIVFTAKGAANSGNREFARGTSAAASLVSLLTVIRDHADFDVTVDGSSADPVAANIANGQQRVRIVALRNTVTGHSGAGVCQVKSARTDNFRIGGANVGNSFAHDFSGGAHGNVAFIYDESTDVLTFGKTGATAANSANITLESGNLTPFRMHEGSSLQLRNANSTIDSSADGELKLSATGEVEVSAPYLAIGNAGTNEGRIRFLEDSDNGSNYVQLQGPALLDGNVTLTLPKEVGPGFLRDEAGDGVLSFSALDGDTEKITATLNAAESFSALTDTSAAGSPASLDKLSNFGTNLSHQSFEKRADVFVNGQLLMSGTYANVTAGAADYVFVESGSKGGSASFNFGGQPAVSGTITLTDNNGTPVTRTYMFINASGSGQPLVAEYQHEGKAEVTINVLRGANAAASRDNFAFAVTGSGRPHRPQPGTGGFDGLINGNVLTLTHAKGGPTSNNGIVSNALGGNPTVPASFVGGADYKYGLRFAFDLEGEDVVTVILR